MTYDTVFFCFFLTFLYKILYFTLKTDLSIFLEFQKLSYSLFFISFSFTSFYTNWVLKTMSYRSNNNILFRHFIKKKIRFEMTWLCLIHQDEETENLQLSEDELTNRQRISVMHRSHIDRYWNWHELLQTTRKKI